jgi:hypothetical protein
VTRHSPFEVLLRAAARQRDCLHFGKGQVFYRQGPGPRARLRGRKTHVDGAVFPGREFGWAIVGLCEVSADGDAGDFQRRRPRIAHSHHLRGAGGSNLLRFES